MRNLILMLTAALALTACDYTEVEREIGYKGKARINPWLAAERFVSQMGWETRSAVSWIAPDLGDAVWVMPASILSNESFNRQAEEWVHDGGHLILLVEHADADTNDWSKQTALPVLEPALYSMLDRVGINLTEVGNASASEVEFEGRSFKVEAESKSTVASRKGEPSVFASVKNGDGRVSVITDGRIFRNRWIGENDHAALLDVLVASTHYEGAVGFMRGSGLSLWALLVEHLWPVLLGLGVWVGLWLWRNFSRFGPVEGAAGPAELRGYEHHLEALGDFQWRFDRAVSLLAPLREQIIELGQRTSTRAGRRDEDFFQFLADRAGLPRERVFRALAEIAPADQSVLTRTTADLQQLLKVLHHPATS